MAKAGPEREWKTRALRAEQRVNDLRGSVNVLQSVVKRLEQELEETREAARKAYGIVVGTHTDESGALGEHCMLCSFAFDDRGECGCPGDLIRDALRAAVDNEPGE